MKSAIAVILGAWVAAGAAPAQAPVPLPPSPAWVTISTEQLRADFDTLWAVSDVHGRLAETDELSNSEFGRFLRGLPVVAFIGSWLFAHSGYIDAKDDRSAVQGYFARLASTWSHEGPERYLAVLDPQSIVSDHNWWRRRSRRSRMKVRLAELGLDGLVFGHDPDALGFQDVIAMDRDGWFIKVDAGMKDGGSPGMLLRCDLARLVRGTKLAMTTDGRPNC